MSLLLRAISRVWARDRPSKRNRAYSFYRDLRPRLPPMETCFQGALADNVFRAGHTQGGLELAGFVARRTGLLPGFPEGAVIAEVRVASAAPREACSARAVASEHAH